MSTTTRLGAPQAALAAISQPIRLPRYLGRERERAFLRARFDALTGGAGSAIVVSGVAGMGKSRLLDEVFVARSPRDATIVRVETRPIADVPFAPLLDLVRALDACGESYDDDRRLADPAPGALLATFGAVLARAAARRPLVVIVEDVHWCDTATRAYLETLAADLARVALLLAITVRTEERRDAALDASCARIEGSARGYAIELRPLGDDELGPAMLEAIRERRILTPRSRDAILERASGNPFFVEALLRAHVDRPTESAEVALPASLRAAVMERFGTLDDATQRLLRVASALGPRARSAEIVELEPTLADRYAASLRRARDASFVVEEDDGFAFAHAIVRETVYATLVRPEARALHARIAERLRAEAADPLTLAHHLWGARSPELADVGERAGDLATQRRALVEAVRCYERALAVVPASEIDTRLRLSRKLAIALEHHGDHGLALPHFRAAVALARSQNRDVETLELSVELARIAHNRGEFAAVAIVAEAARVALHSVDDAHREYAGSLFAVLFALQTRIADARRFLEFVPDAPSSEGAYRVARAQAVTRGMAGDPTWLAYAERALATVPSADALSQFSTLMLFTYVARVYDDHELVARYVHDARRIAERSEIPALLIGIAGEEASVACERGEYRAARGALVATLDATADQGLAGEHLDVNALLLGTLLDDADLIERANVAQVEAYTASPSSMLCGPAAYALELSYERERRPSAQRGVLERLARAVDDATGAAFPLARVARFGSTAAWSRARELLRAAVERFATDGAHGYLALGDAYDAERAGRRAEARRHASEAIARFERAALPRMEGLARELAGDRVGALAIFDRCGNVYDANRLRPRVARSAPSRTNLTQREREIATAIAAGQTPLEAARALFLSRRTIEAHLANAYRKLGVRKRAELVARLAAETPHQERAG
ncbi:MAG: hypothetical protein NVSMB21_02430 [Vulcanimicrobiaceae bacterium]